MKKYYVNNTAQVNTGDHEVHKEGCEWLKLAKSVRDLGYHYSCSTAVVAAKQIYRSADGCKHCASYCHTR